MPTFRVRHIGRLPGGSAFDRSAVVRHRDTLEGSVDLVNQRIVL